MHKLSLELLLDIPSLVVSSHNFLFYNLKRALSGKKLSDNEVVIAKMLTCSEEKGNLGCKT